MSSFFIARLQKAYTFLSPIVDFMPVIPLLFFLLNFCLASCCKFSMRSFILC
ncbi:Photosystem II reaction center protein K [Bienertia sinuspersici]